MPNKLNIQSNDTFNYWTVIKELDSIKSQRQFLCRCKCGNEKRVALRLMRNNSSKSCGCFQNRRVPNLKRRTEHHELVRTRIYNIYNSMKGRCYNKNNDKSKWYLEKGIIICDEWLNSFMNFYNWGMSNGYKDDLTIDRIDVNGNYEPSNCRWATIKEQCNNRTSNIPILIDNVSYSIEELSKLHNIKYATIYRRIKLGWDIKDVINIRPRIGNNKCCKL